MKVGADLEDDIRRATIVREEIGPDRMLAVDANQRWDVGEAIDWMGALAAVRSVLDRGAHEPGRHPRPRGDRPRRRPDPRRDRRARPQPVMFKQFLQAEAIAVCQIDACRLGGVNEVIAVLLLAAKFGVPVCPHAGGVGLCELVQHLSIVDYVCISGSLDGRMIEYVDHLHEHFLDPVVIRARQLPGPDAARLQRRDAARVARPVSVPGWREWRSIATRSRQRRWQREPPAPGDEALRSADQRPPGGDRGV